MSSFLRIALATLLVVLMAGAALAEEGAEKEEEKTKPFVELSGFYAFNGYSQNNFFLGRTKDADAVGGVSDKDEYSIQMFRLTTVFGLNENIKAVVRADLAQGIWGIDNNQNERALRGGFSNVFNRKDTNFLFHVDHAYVDFTHPDWGLNFKIGRMKHTLGNLLVLDQDSDSFMLTKLFDGPKLSFAWAKMSEGADSLSDESAIGPGGVSTEDATLYTMAYTQPVGKWTLNPYVAYYDDSGSAGGSTYLPQGLQYFRPRFQPQISKATAVGLAITGTVGRLELKGEVDYLSGDDDIANPNSGPNELLDVNNGDLEGYNLYADARLRLGPGKLGFVLGLGSGDDDPMEGEGNINKIRTQGFFYITEVWEDSIMPDEEGITPQGLGSPASRGYREFENSTLLQANYTWNISDHWSYFISGTWIKATEALRPWTDLDDSGTIDPGEFGPESSDDLGQELDMKLTWKTYPGLAFVFRGGMFWPGDAAGYLINGTNLYDDKAYELRLTIKYSFGGLRLGG